jgi:hypothetical protein
VLTRGQGGPLCQTVTSHAPHCSHQLRRERFSWKPFLLLIEILLDWRFSDNMDGAPNWVSDLWRTNIGVPSGRGGGEWKGLLKAINLSTQSDGKHKFLGKKKKNCLFSIIFGANLLDWFVTLSNMHLDIFFIFNWIWFDWKVKYLLLFVATSRNVENCRKCYFDSGKWRLYYPFILSSVKIESWEISCRYQNCSICWHWRLNDFFFLKD